jgi:hypothetical protein
LRDAPTEGREVSNWHSEEELARTPWPRFKGEALFESLINHYALDIEEEATFRSWLLGQKYIANPDELGDAQELLALFREWAAAEPEWVGAYSAYRGFRE